MTDHTERRTINVEDPAQLAELLQWQSDNLVRVGEAIGTLATVIGCAIHLSEHVDRANLPQFSLRNTLLRMTEAEYSGGSREILDNLRAALTTGLPPIPPKGGTHLRLVASSDPNVQLRAAG